MMGAFKAVLKKDLVLEVRGGRSVAALSAMSLLVLVALVLALDAPAGAQGRTAAAAALWVAMVFAGTVGATQVVPAEFENGCLHALLSSPLDRTALYGAKLVAAFIFMAAAELLAAIIAVLFFNLEFDLRIARMAAPMIAGTLGFAALATLLAAASVKVRAGDLVLPLLMVPLFAPAMLAGVRASAAALNGEPWSTLWPWLKLLAVFDLVFVTAGCLLFDFVVRED